MKRLSVALTLLLLATRLAAQKADAGSVVGSVIDQASGQPIEYATLELKKKTGNETVGSAVTDSRGAFTIESVAFGDYRAFYGSLGTDRLETPPFTVDAQHRTVDLGRLVIGNTAVKMEKFEVTTRRETFANSIDRKVYNIGTDIQSATGSVSNLLSNVPSVEVGVEGDVSLRGNSNFLMLVDGKPSTLMNTANRATALEQMPADSIEKIEVITNPSAKYTPNGTAGIINITLKRKREAGYSATVRANVGNDSRSSVGLTANYNPGKFNLYGAMNVRQDDRPRFTQDNRSHLDSATNSVVSTSQTSVEHMRPLSRLAQLGADYKVSDATKLGASVNYNYRTFFRTATVRNQSSNANGTLTSDYDRDRTDPEWQKTVEYATTYQHSFAKEGHELDLELKHDRHWEQEDNHFTDIYRTPATPTSFDYTLIKPTETSTELTADYSYPFDNDGKLDAGYSLQVDKNDMDFHGGFTDPVSGLSVVDPTTTNRFIYRDHIHAFYATYGRPIGKFGFLAGLRAEQALINSDQVTANLTGNTTYLRLYPTLHLSYNLTETTQLQLNYSHRIHRPESDDLNPFPEYQDPYNLRAGNPHLLPEETHSIETGLQYKKDNTTYLATVYYRQTYHAFTTITRYINSTTLLTTQENLSTNRSGGLELGVSGDLGHQVTVNFSSNAYYSEIDASNLGYSATKSTIAWNAKLNASWHATKSDLIQFNTNYTAKRLTAQGDRLPTFIANVGLKHDFKDKKTAFVFTVSDLFDSLKERTVINTPALHDEITSRRSARIIYAGFVYNFGKPVKKKDDTLQFDDKL
jgi:outer membrane receptor protein involved in Fe transport